ncbi:MAG: hypothetical protein SF182_13465 [Deltaproteobacteria bacterium]|nr:hypothetical protein [Deltaproteobacteria bacterium]
MPRFMSAALAALLVGLASLAAVDAADAQGVCPGDCNRDDEVRVNELVGGVNQALGAAGDCAAFDSNDDGAVAINELIAAVNAALDGCGGYIRIITPTHRLAVQAGTVAVEILLPTGTLGDHVEIELDQVDVTDQFTITDLTATATLLDVAPGRHQLTAAVTGLTGTTLLFTAVALDNPDECEVLNQAHCLLPYPSSRFLVPDAGTATGVRVHIPDVGLPQGKGTPVTAEYLNELDGFSPTVQILMHFPAGVDLAASEASRLLPAGCCEQPAGPPWTDTRTYDGRSLDADSPSVLLDLTSNTRVLHWLEPDARADGNPARQTLIMRPGASLVPGHRYAVAMRDLRATDGQPVVAEPAFALFRDRQASNIAAIESRRAAMEALFDALQANGIARDELVLAFDFVVQSENQLTRQMLSMRDQAFALLAQAEADPEAKPFTVSKVEEHDCGVAGTATWRDVSGTFRAPLFLTASPDGPGAPQLNVDADDVPVQNGFYDAVFSVAIPCGALQDDAPPPHPIVLGHGLFGTGAQMTRFVPALANAVVPWNYIAGATDWRGLSAPDLGFVAGEIIGLGESKLHQFPALPDRLRQGMLNTLVLGRMMKRGLFNRDAAFQRAGGAGVFPGPESEMYYYGISLGGIMGTWFSALTPDVERFGVDVPAINFSCLLQRSTQFSSYDTLLDGIGISDPLDKLLGLQLLHELWVSAEPAGYARHITGDPLPGSGEAKRILMTPAWLDKQVSNQCSEIAARTLQLANLAPGSLQRGLQGIPDVDGPLASAYVMYDSGAFDLFNPAHAPFIPPLANQIPSAKCDPHGARPAIPAGIRQLVNFLRPDGQVENFCNGDCDAGDPSEIAGGAATPCDPLK